MRVLFVGLLPDALMSANRSPGAYECGACTREAPTSEVNDKCKQLHLCQQLQQQAVNSAGWYLEYLVDKFTCQLLLNRTIDGGDLSKELFSSVQQRWNTLAGCYEQLKTASDERNYIRYNITRQLVQMSLRMARWKQALQYANECIEFVRC